MKKEFYKLDSHKHYSKSELKALTDQGKIIHFGPLPTVGMGGTSGFGSDSYPYTVVSVSKDGKRIEVTQDDHKPAPGFDYYKNQEYEYTSRPNGARETFRLRKNGVWVKDGQPVTGGQRMWLGHRRYYQDPHF